MQVLRFDFQKLQILEILNFHSCIANNMDSDQTAPWEQSGQGSIACFHEKIYSEVHLNICSKFRKQMTFSGQKKWWDKG